MAHAASTYAAQLVLVDQSISHSAVAHVAHVTFALGNEGPSTVQECADKFQDAFFGAFTSVLDTEATFEKPNVLLGDGTAYPLTAIGGGPAEAGASAIASPSPQISALLKKTTAFAGRKNRGRTYLPFCIGDDGIDQAGRITGDAPTDIQAACDAFLTSLNTFEVPMIICNRDMGVDGVTGKPYVIEYQVGPAVTGYVLETFVATQRRRLVRS